MNTHSLGCWHGSMKHITGNKYHVVSWRAASPERLEFSLSFSRLYFSLNRFHAILHSSSTYTALMTQVFGMLPGFLVNLLKSGNLFCNATAATKTALGITEPCEKLLGPPKKIQMGPFNISKHLGRCVLFGTSCKLAPSAALFQNLTKLN